MLRKAWKTPLIQEYVEKYKQLAKVIIKKAIKRARKKGYRRNDTIPKELAADIALHYSERFISELEITKDLIGKTVL